MMLIDDRGRLFGRVNVIDGVVAVLVIGLIPLAYGAYLLFREPAPRIVSVEPSKITPTTTHVKLTGEHLRPFLRVSFNQVQGATFALLSPTTAEVKVPTLPSGTYDVVLFDVAREVHRLPAAVTVDAAPPQSTQASVLVAGAFVALDDQSTRQIVKGARLTAVGGNHLQILEVGASQPDGRWVLSGETLLELPLASGRQMPALLRSSCTIADRRCQIGGIDVQPSHNLSLFASDGATARFVIDEAFPDGPRREAELSVRLVTPSETNIQIRSGDRDRGNATLGTRLASVVSVGATRRVAAQNLWRQTMPWTGAGDWSLGLQDVANVIDVRFRVTLDMTSDGPRYRGRPVNAGASFLFQTQTYSLRGWVLGVTMQDPAPTDQ